eukprot:655263-Hanusia_phi.AAC.1
MPGCASEVSSLRLVSRRHTMIVTRLALKLGSVTGQSPRGGAAAWPLETAAQRAHRLLRRPGSSRCSESQ